MTISIHDPYESAGGTRVFYTLQLPTFATMTGTKFHGTNPMAHREHSQKCLGQAACGSALPLRPSDLRRLRINGFGTAKLAQNPRMGTGSNKLRTECDGSLPKRDALRQKLAVRPCLPFFRFFRAFSNTMFQQRVNRSTKVYVETNKSSCHSTETVVCQPEVVGFPPIASSTGWTAT